MEAYLIMGCGYEGIELLVGIYDKDTAIEMMKKLRAQKTQREYVCVGDLLRAQGYVIDEMESLSDQVSSEVFDKAYRESRMTEIAPERFCVQLINGEGSKCVCADLGVSIDTPILY